MAKGLMPTTKKTNMGDQSKHEKRPYTLTVERLLWDIYCTSTLNQPVHIHSLRFLLLYKSLRNNYYNQIVQMKKTETQ